MSPLCQKRTSAYEPWEKYRRPYGQKRADSRDADYRSNGEVRASDEMAAEAVPNQKIEDDDV